MAYLILKSPKWQMPNRRKLLWTIMLLSLLGLAAFFIVFHKQNSSSFHWTPENVKPYKQWFQINWQKQAIGWASVELVKDNEQVSIIEQDFITGRVQSQRMEFQYQRKLTFENKAPYKLTEASIESVEPNLIVSKQISNTEKLTVVEIRNDKSKQTTHEPVDYYLTDYLALNHWLEQPNRKAVLLAKEFNNDDYGLHYSRYKQLDGDTTNGQFKFKVQHQLQNTNQLDDKYQSQATLLDISQDFRLLRQQKANGMIYIESQGKVTINPEMQRDLYIASGIKVDRPLGDPQKIDYLELNFPQAFVSKIKTHPAIKVSGTKLQLSRGYQYPSQLTPKVQSSHTRAKALAESLVNSSSTKEQKVNKLVNYVNQHLTYQTLPSSFELDDILDNRIGDCTEHALLLAEMLNGIDIPARQVSGLIYLGDDKQRFGGHVWVEVYLDGQWRAVDPTWNLTQVGATHIPLLIGADKTPEILQNADQFEFSLVKMH